MSSVEKRITYNNILLPFANLTTSPDVMKISPNSHAMTLNKMLFHMPLMEFILIFLLGIVKCLSNKQNNLWIHYHYSAVLVWCLPDPAESVCGCNSGQSWAWWGLKKAKTGNRMLIFSNYFLNSTKVCITFGRNFGRNYNSLVEHASFYWKIILKPKVGR